MKVFRRAVELVDYYVGAKSWLAESFTATELAAFSWQHRFR